MRIGSYILRVIGLLVLLQLAAIAVTIALGTPKTIDTSHSRKTIFQTDSKMVVYGSPVVARGSNKQQIVILGTSNTTMGLRPDRLQPHLGDVPIHNLSVGSEKFRAMGQVVDLLFRQTPLQQRRNYVFVIGISYPLLPDTAIERQRMRTSIDDEERRFALFSIGHPHGSVPRVADRWLSAALQVNWPFLIPKAVYNSIIRMLPQPYRFGLTEWVPFTAEESNTIQYNQEQNQVRINYYNSEIIDTTGEFTFDPLMDTVKRITAAGGEVVIVDLPTAQWLRQKTKLYNPYVKLRKPYIAQLEKMPHVRYVNIEKGYADEDFYDGVHPRNRITPQIAREVAPTILDAMKENQ